MWSSTKLHDMTTPRHYIREHRKKAELSQEQFAERMGVSQGFISKIERGQQNPDLAFLEKAAEVLRCRPSDLIDRDPSYEARIMEVYKRMTTAQQDQLIEIAKTLMKVS